MSSEERSFPLKVDLTGEDAITQGAYYRRHFQLAYGDGVLWNTTGFTGYMRIRSAVGGPAQIDLHTYQGRILVGIMGVVPYQYNLAIVLPGAVTQPLTAWGTGVYDLIVRASGSTEWLRVLEGNVELSPMVSPPF